MDGARKFASRGGWGGELTPPAGGRVNEASAAGWSWRERDVGDELGQRVTEQIPWDFKVRVSF